MYILEIFSCPYIAAWLAPYHPILMDLSIFGKQSNILCGASTSYCQTFSSIPVDLPHNSIPSLITQII